MPARLLLLLPSTTYRATAFVEAARRLEVELSVATDRGSVFGDSRPGRYVILDFADARRAAGQARAFAAQYPVAAVVGVDDDTAVLAAWIAEALELPGNPVDAAMAARDKHRQRVLLSGAGVPVPGFRLRRLDEDPAAVARATGYPCVLKPLCLSASRGVIRADSAAGFVAAHEQLVSILGNPDVVALGEAARHYLVETYVPGPEVALEGLLDAGRLTVLALFDKPDPLEGPYFEESIYVTPSRLEPAAQEAVAGCAQRAATALGLATGPVHAELRFNDAGPWLIELAARPIGGRCSRVLRFGEGGAGEAAAALEEVLLRHALGLPIATLRREAEPAGVMMIPTPRAGRLRAVRGVEAARAVAGVDGVEITAHRGQELVPPPALSQYLGFIYARGPSPEAVTTSLREAHAKLAFDVASAPD